MHRNSLWLVALPLVAGLGLAAARDGATQPAKTGRVNVNAQCINGEIKPNINPWRLEIEQGDDVEWNIHESPRVDSISIYPKKGWPFNDAPPYKGRQNSPAGAGNMKPDQAGKTYQYNVEVWCTDNHGEELHEVIDPDIIIKGETGRER